MDKIAKLNLPNDVPTIKVCSKSEHGSLQKLNMPQNYDGIFKLWVIILHF